MLSIGRGSDMTLNLARAVGATVTFLLGSAAIDTGDFRRLQAHEPLPFEGSAAFAALREAARKTC
jgi:hypothetical protein